MSKAANLVNRFVSINEAMNPTSSQFKVALKFCKELDEVYSKSTDSKYDYIGSTIGHVFDSFDKELGEHWWEEFVSTSGMNFDALAKKFGEDPIISLAASLQKYKG